MSADDTKSRGHGDKRSRKLDEFIAALLSSNSVEDAARAAGISLSSARRWLKDPIVAARLRELRRDVMARCMSKLQDNATRAADNLDELQRTAESEAVRLAASRANLGFAFRTVELVDVLERLTMIEQKLKSPEGRRNHATEPSLTPPVANRGVNGRA